MTDRPPSEPLENHKEELFVHGLLESKSQLKAYEDAGYAANDGHASRLAGIGRVSARLAYLQGQVATQAIVTVATLTEDLLQIRDAAKLAGDLRVRESTTMSIAKLNGLIVDKSQLDANVRTIHEDIVDTPDFSPEQRAVMLVVNSR